jgi:uncharacterized membrane protein
MRPSLFAVAIATACCGTAHATGSFIPLQTPTAQATKFSQNGEYLAAFLNGTGGVRWTRATGAEELVPGMVYSNGINNLGTVSGAMSTDGGNANGGHDLPALSPIGAATPQALPLPAGIDNVDVYDVSDDGSAVGLAWTDDFSVAKAYYYSSVDGVMDLPVDSTTSASRGNAISADGSVIGGWSDDPTTGFRRGVVWIDRVATYVQDADGNPVGEADGVSGNGQFVVGGQYAAGGCWLFNVATGEVTQIPTMPFAFGVSDDGKVVVGASGFFDNPPRAAYIWTEAGGSQLLSDYMAARGIEVPAGWDFSGGLTAVSGDGSMVAGWTLFGATGMQSFIVTGINDPLDKIFADGFDGAPAENPVQDSSFEASISGSGPWASTSDTFGTALCTVATCGDGGGTAGPHTGSAWAWFGGVPAAEDATVSQSITIPAGGPAYLNFWLWIGAVNGGTSTMDVSVDGTVVASFPEPVDAEAGYTQRGVDIGAYADGAAHTIEFHYVETDGLASNYHLDDVTIDNAPAAHVPASHPARPHAAGSAQLRRR